MMISSHAEKDYDVSNPTIWHKAKI